MKVSIYIGNNLKKLDLFDDENIFFIQKLNDIDNLSNIFSDTTLSFTVPATDNNNSIFKHYYDIYINNGIIPNTRIPAYIEIDTIPYKFGQIEIDNIKINNFLTKDYKITFYDNVTQLKTLFSDDLLRDLDYDITDNVKTKVRSDLSYFDFIYNSQNIVNSINLPSYKDGDLITPLISYTNRDWNYGGISPNLDISIDNGAIRDSELKPALRIIKLIEAIENKYNITFSRDFLNRSVFLDLFMWLNRLEDSRSPYTATYTNAFGLTSSSAPYLSPSFDNEYIKIIRTSNLSNVEIDFRIIFILIPDIGFENVNYSMFIKDENNNLLRQRTNRKGTRRIEFKVNIPRNRTGFQRKMKLEILSDNVLNCKIKIELRVNGSSNEGSFSYIEWISDNNSQEIINLIRVEEIIPELKVVDFITGLMKMFKLIIRPITTTDFYLDTIDSFYSKGRLINLTDYTNQEGVLIETPDIYKKIEFKYQKTENVAGKRFRDINNFGVGYGDLVSNFNINKQNDLKVELPFENMLFERLFDVDDNLTNIIIGQSISLNNSLQLSPNNSKPILFYNNGITSLVENDIAITSPFKFKFSNETPEDIYYCYIMGNSNNELIELVNNSINFGSEVDSWHLQEIDLSLYRNYWENWINTVYDRKQRKFKYKCKLPTRLVNEISLNDRIVIGDTRYKINDFKVNLLDGDTELNLFVDIYEPTGVITSDSVFPESIETNAGIKHYDIILTTNKKWTLSLEDTGDNNDWVEIKTPTSGEGITTITIKVNEKVSQPDPQVYNDRELDLRITFDDASDIDITIKQLGLLEP
jgi:hypothetical protein